MGMLRPRVYLCGPINGCNNSECRDWREWFKNHDSMLRHLIWVDPMKRDYRGTELAHYREIVDLDKSDIKKCDIVVAMADRPSWGTAMEIHFSHQMGVPVLAICSGAISPWLRYHSSFVCESMDQAAVKLMEWIR